MRFSNFSPKLTSPKPQVKAKPRQPIKVQLFKPIEVIKKYNDKMKAFMATTFSHMKEAGVPQEERRTTVAYALAVLVSRTTEVVPTTESFVKTLNDDVEEEGTFEDYNDTAEEMPVDAPLLGSPGSSLDNPIVLDDDDDDITEIQTSNTAKTTAAVPANALCTTTVLPTSTTGQDVDITWTHPADLASPAPVIVKLEEVAVKLEVASDDMIWATAQDASISGPSSIGVQTKSASKKRAREVEVDGSIDARNVRARVESKPTPSARRVSRPEPISFITVPNTHSIIERNGIRFHYTTGPSGTLPPRGPALDKNGQIIPPFNHYPQLPRPLPQGLQREYAFCGRSHPEVYWTKGFGTYVPPKTQEEALSSHCYSDGDDAMSSGSSSSSSAFRPATPVETTLSPANASASTSTALPSVPRKRLRDTEDNGDAEGAPSRRRARSF
ncbi:hypothetical protein DXG01_002603 [Tephrocybe rancida]|nr:hypothetical protein DXG01_002603 [Tephrocybe rancida]